MIWRILFAAYLIIAFAVFVFVAAVIIAVLLYKQEKEKGTNN